MPLKGLFKAVLSIYFLALALIGNAQNKSTNLQNIDGKKYYLHKIEKSQSLYAISKLYNVSLDELYTNNPELKNGAKAGQEIKIPAFNVGGATVTTATVTSVDTSKFIVHKVAKGETIYSITKKYNSSERLLGNYNPTLSDGIKEGQLLIVGEKGKRKQAPATVIKEPKAPVIVKEIKPNTPIVDSAAFKPISKPRKTAYNVALILPLRLEAASGMDVNELAKNNSAFPTVPGLAIDFYLGFKKAMDSLSNKDFEINLQVFDVDDKDSLKIIELIASPKFTELDFIFGPFYPNGFKAIAKKAKELRIPIVSPITRQNKILYNNIYISKTNPSQFTLLENLADYCIDSLKNQSTYVTLVQLNDKDKKEQQFIAAFKKRYAEKLKLNGKVSKDSLIVVKGIAGLKPFLSPLFKNIVITLSNSQLHVIDFITQLNMAADKKDVTLCGWQEMSEMENIDQDYLNRLNYTFPCQFNLTNTAAYKPLYDYYKMLQETTPPEYFFIGFDIAYYYFNHLKNLGPDFIYTLNTLSLETNYMNFKFTRPDNATGFDNQGVYLFKYNNYQLQKTGWK